MTTVDTLAPDFHASVDFDAPAETIFEAVTTPRGLSAWWTPASGSGLVGGQLTFSMTDSDVIVRVEEAARPSLVRWSPLVCEPAPDWVGTTIVFTIEPRAGGGSRLHFRHVGLTPQLECYDMCHAGWTRYLASLAQYIHTGTGSPRGTNNAA